MAIDSALPVEPDFGENSDSETEEAIARKDGLALLDDLISTFYDRVQANIDKHFRTGDLIRMIELRYKLSPTNAEQEKFWAMLAKVRRAALEKKASAERSQKIEEPKK